MLKLILSYVYVRENTYEHGVKIYKSAHIRLSVTLKKPTCVFDTRINRVGNRKKIESQSMRKKTYYVRWEDKNKIFPLVQWHQRQRMHPLMLSI